jgi:hypothetical protein
VVVSATVVVVSATVVVDASDASSELLHAADSRATTAKRVIVFFIGEPPIVPM